MKQIDVKPEWLRKGNLMTNNLNGELIIVKAYDIYCLEEGMDSFIMQPIPLNEEWLLYLGFDRIGNCFRKIYDYGLGYREFILWFDTSKNKFIFKASNNLTEIDYVHEVQNLYPIIAKEELTLKQ